MLLKSLSLYLPFPKYMVPYSRFPAFADLFSDGIQRSISPTSFFRKNSLASQAHGSSLVSSDLEHQKALT